MSAEYVWGAIFIMMGVTYISRIIPFLLLAGKPVPRWFKTWLTYMCRQLFSARWSCPTSFCPQAAWIWD